MNRQPASNPRNSSVRFAASLTLWVLSLVLIGCGSEGTGPLGASTDQGSGADESSRTRSGGDLPGGLSASGIHTLGATLGAIGKGDSGEDSSGALAGDHEPTLEQQRAEAMDAVVRMSPEDQTGLYDALREPDPAVQLVALERLGERAQWDTEARRTLEDFRRSDVAPGLQRRAADLLSTLGPLPSAPTSGGASTDAG